MALISKITPLNGVTATTTSEAFDLQGADRATFVLKRSAHGSGNTVFTFTVSVDGVTYVPYSKLITDAANTNAQTPIRVASVTLSADGTALVSMDLSYDNFHSAKAVATETTDGTHTVTGIITYN